MSDKAWIEELRKKAEKATPGPWTYDGCSLTDWGRQWESSMSMEWMANGHFVEGIADDSTNENEENDGAYLAAASPDRILELIGMVENYEAVVERILGREDKWVDRFEAAEAEVMALEAQVEAAKFKWIDVKERLPQGGMMCLVVLNGHVQHVPYSRDGVGFACECGYEWNAPESIGSDPIPDGEVTHWMPFPDPPVEDSKRGEL